MASPSPSDKPLYAANVAAGDEGAWRDACHSRRAMLAAGGLASAAALLSGTQAAARTGNACENVNVADYGAVGDGRSDSASAFQAAIEAAGDGGKIRVPAGRYLCHEALAFKDFQTLEGDGWFLGTGGRPRTEVKFTLSAGPAVKCGTNMRIESLLFRNILSYGDDYPRISHGSEAYCLDVPTNVLLRDVQFYSWDRAVVVTGGAYYTKFWNCEFAYCRQGIVVDGEMYNAHLDGITMRRVENCLDASRNPIRNLKIFGGSFEDYAAGFRGLLEAAVFGAYFETRQPEAMGLTGLARNASIQLFGCVAYLNAHDRFVDLEHALRPTVTSFGNTWVSYEEDGFAKVVYWLPEDGEARITVAGDKLDGGAKDLWRGRYVSSDDEARRHSISWPLGHPNADTRYLGAKGLVLEPSTRAPVQPVDGGLYLADGVEWDPLGRAVGHPYYVVWGGGRWISLA